MIAFAGMRTFFSRLLLTSLCIAVSQLVLFSSSARAMDQDMRAVIRGGTYGLIGGTVVGIAVLPLTGSARGVFIGSSLGLYMGILMGVYHITHRDDPTNPVRGQMDGPHAPNLSHLPNVMDTPGSANAYFADNRARFNEPPRTPMEVRLPARFALSFPVMRF